MSTDNDEVSIGSRLGTGARRRAMQEAYGLTNSMVKVRPGGDRATAASLLAARQIRSSSGRREDTPVRKSFVRGIASRPAPMSQLYSGGRSGVVPIKLYLALIWRCSSEPYETDKPARSWATLLDLPDPAVSGTRRINAAIRTLARHKLVTTRSQPGHPNMVQLRDENGSGRTYNLPSTSHVLATSRHRSKTEISSHIYFKLATKLWTSGYVQALSGPALVILLILLAEQGGEGEPVWFGQKAFEDRYDISPQTRTAGTKELQASGLLHITRASIAVGAYSSVFDARRMRNIYHLEGAALTSPRATTLSTSNDPWSSNG